MQMHLYNQTYLLYLLTWLCSWTSSPVPFWSQTAGMLLPCWKAGGQPRGPTCDYTLPEPRTPHSTNITAAMSEAFVRSHCKVTDFAIWEEEAASTTATMMWRGTDVYKRVLRGVTLGTLLKAAAKKGALAQRFKNKPLERSRILAMLQVPFPSTSKHQMDFFQQIHQLCVTQTKGTEEFMVFN